MTINHNKKQFIKFIFFGGLNTLFAYLILVFFLFLGFHYTLATLISALLSIASGYFLNKNMVFLSKKSKNLYQYYIFWFLMYQLSIFIQYILLNHFSSTNLYLNSLIATIVTSFISFFINKYYFFAE